MLSASASAWGGRPWGHGRWRWKPGLAGGHPDGPSPEISAEKTDLRILGKKGLLDSCQGTSSHKLLGVTVNNERINNQPKKGEGFEETLLQGRWLNGW